MKEKETVPEKITVIDIKLTKGLVVTLACVMVIVGLLAYLTLTGKRAVASEAETAQAASTGMRQFYLTQSDIFMGNMALTACAPGYHMASLWEIADPSNLKYNPSLGFKQDDSGEGPPSDTGGWIRTGYASSNSDDEGKGNCNVWASNEDDEYGTVAYLPEGWTAGDDDISVWAVDWNACWHFCHVWCIED